MKQPVYLVPFDFTEVAESATRLALELAHTNNGSVYLLHIVSNTKDRMAKRMEFVNYVSNLQEKDQNVIRTKVLIGDLFEDTGKAGNILDASFIVMGTHGLKGFQKLTGSNAVKMINNSSTPFLITQGKKEVENVKNIVMPFSFHKETIQITQLAGSVAKNFNAKIHLCANHESDEWLEAKTQTNQKIVREFLHKNNVECEIVNLPITGNYEQNLLDYSKSIDADIIAAAYYKDGIIQSPNSFIQTIIDNEYHIPLLTINTEEFSVISSSYSFINV